MGKRGPKSRKISFDEARQLVRKEGIPSVGQYKQWHKLNKPAGIPIRPDKAYKPDFISWNDFLGNDNPFPIKRRKYRIFNEARAFAQSLRISKKDEWVSMYDSGGVPDDIPKRPDLYYRKKDEWVSWGNFLGVNMLARSETIMETNTIFFVIQNPKTPRGYYRCGVTNGGVSSINDFVVKVNGKVVLAYHVPTEFNYKKLLDSLGYMEDYDHKNYYKISNMTPLVSKLSINYNQVSF